MLPTGVQIGLGVRPAAVSVMLAQGSLTATGGDLDVAIDGPGYIEVTMPSGEAGYTRDGALKRSADGQIVTSDGYPVAPGITIPSDARSIAINAAGEVWAYFDRPGRARASGPAHPDLLHQRKGTGGDRVEPVPGKPGLGPALVGTPGTGGAGHAAAGLPGGKLGRSRCAR
jgi:flagellar basal-body rod protein FlgG